MAVLSDLVSRVRSELADTPQQFRKVFTGDGAGVDFALGVKPVDNATIAITVADVAQAQPSDFTIEDKLGVIHFVTPPAAGAKVVVTGNVFRYFTDEEITYYVNTSLTQHTDNRTDGYGRKISLKLLPAVEDYPLVILSTIEALWALATDAAFDINIQAPDGVSIPRAQRYQQITDIINRRWEQYRALCAALNIGLWRIEMGTLRRVSRTTNKLVPVYVAQEVDDSRRPERVWISTDMLGRNPTPSTVPIYDWILMQGDKKEVIFDFPFDVSDLDFKAQVRTYPNAPALYATFTITVLSCTSNLSRVKLSITKQNSAYLPLKSFWDLQATSKTDDSYEQTFMKGQVFCEQQTTLD